jgi:hypothetical protein
MPVSSIFAYKAKPHRCGMRVPYVQIRTEPEEKKEGNSKDQK